MSGEWSLGVLPLALPSPTPLPFPLQEHPDPRRPKCPPSLHWVLPSPPPQLCKHPSPAGTEGEGRVPLAPALSCPPLSHRAQQQPQEALCPGVRLSCSLLCSMHPDS